MASNPAARTQVALVRCRTYERAQVEQAVSGALGLLGGIERFVTPGANVLIKPNLIAAHPAASCVTTHPEVVRAVALAAATAGGVVAIGDSPGVGTFAEAAAASGIAAVARELDVPLRELCDPVEAARPSGARFRRVLLARAAVEADVVINLAKVKTHQQMFLTLAVKNAFGCVVGREKAAWHLSAGCDAGVFARALVEICDAVGPALSLADGVVGMEGAGPSHGRPRPLGFVAASADPFALDTVVTQLLGYRPEDLPVIVAAREACADGLQVGVTDASRIAVVGCTMAELRVSRIEPPPGGRLMFVPDSVGRVARRFVTARPRVRASRCSGCGVCVGSCPAGAMKMVDRRVRIDDTSCIRCFCCQELCPEGAVQVRCSLLSRLFLRSGGRGR